MAPRACAVPAPTTGLVRCYGYLAMITKGPISILYYEKYSNFNKVITYYNQTILCTKLVSKNLHKFQSQLHFDNFKAPETIVKITLTNRNWRKIPHLVSVIDLFALKKYVSLQSKHKISFLLFITNNLFERIH